MSWLYVNNVNKRYGNKKIINNISFTAESGITLLYGNNGSGKSTIISMLEGLTNIDSGNINILGYNPFKNYMEIMKNIAFIPERPSYFISSKISEFVNYYLSINNINKSNFMDYIKLFGIENIMHENFSSLSLGESKLMGLSLAFSGKPKFMVLDEPTEGIDINKRMIIYGILSDMKDNGTRILITTHEINEIEDIIEKIVYLKNGKVVNSCNFRTLFYNSNIIKIKSMNLTSIEKKLRSYDIDIENNVIKVYNMNIDNLISLLTNNELKDITSIEVLPYDI